MAPTDYTVASAATLLGAKPPRRREIEAVYFEQISASDRRNREWSQLQRTAEVKWNDGEKKMRFTPSARNMEDGSHHGKQWMEFAAALEGNEADADRIQAEKVETSAVAASSSLISGQPASFPSNTSRNTESTNVDGSNGTNNDQTGRGAGTKDDPGFWGAAPASFPATRTLPFAHLHRFRAKLKAQNPTGLTRLDTSGGGKEHDDDAGRSNSAAASNAGYTAASSASAAVSAAPGRQHHPHHPDVFFTPVDVNRSTIEFHFFHANAPMSATPRVRGSSSDGSSFEPGASLNSNDSSPLLRRASTGKRVQQQYRNASFDARSSRRRNSAATKTTSKREKITVSPEQLDRLIVALANAPLVHTHLRKQWLEHEGEDGETTGNPSLLSLRSALRQTDRSDSTPSLTNNSTASDAPSDSSSGLDGRANTTFVHEPTLDDDDAAAAAGRPALTEHRLSYTRPRAKFGGIALTDPKVAGGPIRFVSKGYKKGANILQVGQCSFLNIPYSSSSDCILRVEPGDLANGGAACSVTIQIMAQVLERKRGRRAYLLVADVDVTESLTKAVLVEFARHTGFSLEDIEVGRPEPPVRHDSFQQQENDPIVDWCALADELQASWSTNEIIDNAIHAFKSLDAETCTMQTLILLSELERIKAQHVDFLVLRSPAARQHSNGMPTSISVPWISQHLDRHVNLWSPEASSLFREDLVAAVGRRHADGEPFAVRVLWGRKKKIVRCVPLLEGEDGRVAGHVAFVGDEFEF